VQPGRLLEALVPRSVIGFCYHTVADKPLAHVESLYRCKSVAQFRRDLEFLGRRYRIAGYDDLAAGRAHDGKSPAAVITFDDGLAECYDVIRPVLLELGIPAIFFVTRDFLDNRALFYRQKVALALDSYAALTPAAAATLRRDVSEAFGSRPLSPADFAARLKCATWKDEPAIDATCKLLGIDIEDFLRTTRPYMTRAQVRSLAADGFTIGAHGTAHRLMGTMSDAEVLAEVLASTAAVSELVPARAVPFAFPFNGRGVSRDVLAVLRESSPQLGLFFDSTELARDADFVVNRLVVDDPAGAPARGSNLPARIRRAYARELVRPLAGARGRTPS